MLAASAPAPAGTGPLRLRLDEFRYFGPGTVPGTENRLRLRAKRDRSLTAPAPAPTEFGPDSGSDFEAFAPQRQWY